MSTIQFFQEDVDNPLDESQENGWQHWIEQTILQEMDTETGDINIIFCSDEYLLSINRQYLNHDYYTDILTFPYQSSPLTADLYISTERVKENAGQIKEPFITELSRVIIHGVLHLCGYGDKTDEEKKVMRSKENEYLHILFNGE